jgi:hypothetical protein
MPNNNTLKVGDVVKCVRSQGGTTLEAYTGPGGALYRVKVAIPGGVGAVDRHGDIAKAGVIVRRLGDHWNHTTVWDEDRFKLFLPGRARFDRISRELNTCCEASIRKEFWKQCADRRRS